MKFYSTWVYVFKPCTKFEWNRIIHGWSSYRQFSAFSHAILGGQVNNWQLSQGCVDPTSPNLSRTYRGDHGSIALLFQNSISCRIFKRGRLKVEWSWKRRQISHFCPPPVKIRGGVSEIFIPIVEALPTTEAWWPINPLQSTNRRIVIHWFLAP